MNEFEEHFIKAGKMFYALGILFLINIIYTLISFFFGYGNVWFILDIVEGFIILSCQIAFWIILLVNIKKIKEMIPDDSIARFFSRKTIGFILFCVSTVYILFSPTPPANTTDINVLMDYMFIMLIGYAIMYVSWIFDYLAFSMLENFFMDHAIDTFGQYLGLNILDGTKKIKSAMLSYLLFFFLITVFYAIYAEIAGYIKLGDALSKINKAAEFEHGGIYRPGSPTPPRVNAYTENYPISTNTTKPENNDESTSISHDDFSKKFCKNCGTPIKFPGQRFCQNCGSKL